MKARLFCITVLLFVTYCFSIPTQVFGEKKSIKEILYLPDCRTVQDEDSHIQEGHGSMYAMDIACVRGESFKVYTPDFKEVYKVSKVSYDDRIGNYIVLKHGEYELVFGHTKSKLKVGDRLKPKDPIGRIDLSGMTKNYHLHFELWKNDYNISYAHLNGAVVRYNMEYTYKLRRQRGWYVGLNDATKLIVSFEGYRKCAYLDGDSGRFSIGFGTISYKGECISKDEALKRKKKHVEYVLQNIYENHFVENHNKRVALTSAMYNLGVNSDIYKVKYRKKDKGICSYFKKFRMPDSIYEEGLLKRRTKECECYIGDFKCTNY